MISFENTIYRNRCYIYRMNTSCPVFVVKIHVVIDYDILNISFAIWRMKLEIFLDYRYCYWIIVGTMLSRVLKTVHMKVWNSYTYFHLQLFFITGPNYNVFIMNFPIIPLIKTIWQKVPTFNYSLTDILQHSQRQGNHCFQFLLCSVQCLCVKSITRWWANICKSNFKRLYLLSSSSHSSTFYHRLQLD